MESGEGKTFSAEWNKKKDAMNHLVHEKWEKNEEKARRFCAEKTQTKYYAET